MPHAIPSVESLSGSYALRRLVGTYSWALQSCVWVGCKGILQLSWVIAPWVELEYLSCEWLITFFTLPVWLERGNRGPEWLRPACSRIIQLMGNSALHGTRAPLCLPPRVCV
jgi:hypothetical protein